jgi:hypothetical protein
MPVAYININPPATSVNTIRIIVAIIGDTAFLRAECGRDAPRAMDFITPSCAGAI